MIRGRDNAGCIVLGLTRREVEALLKGARCCFQAGTPDPDSPHVCIYFGETNADILARLRQAYAADSGMMRALGEPQDFRTIPERGDN